MNFHWQSLNSFCTSLRLHPANRSTDTFSMVAALGSQHSVFMHFVLQQLCGHVFRSSTTCMFSSKPIGVKDVLAWWTSSKDAIDKHYLEVPMCVRVCVCLFTRHMCMLTSHPYFVYGSTHVHLPLPTHVTLSSVGTDPMFTGNSSKYLLKNSPLFQYFKVQTVVM